MRYIDKLKQQRAALLDQLEVLSNKVAGEQRLMTDDEQREFDGILAKVSDLAETIERQGAADALLRRDTTAQPVIGTGPRLIDGEGRVLRALGPSEKLADLVPPQQRLADAPSLGAVVRGMCLGKWERADIPGVGKAMGVFIDQPFPVPEPLSNVWLDKLRAAAVSFAAGAITVPMTSMTQTIVQVTQEPTFKWRVEHVPLDESPILVGPLQMKARLAGTLVRMSIELLEDSPISEQLVETVLLRAAAVEIDRVMLAAAGNQVAPSDEPKGLINWPIGSIDAVVPPTNFDPMLDAMGEVLAANDTPTAMIGNTSGLIAGAKLKDTTNQPLNMPEPLASLPKFWTPIMPANTSVTGNFQWLAWALRTGLTLEATRVGGDGTFKNVQYLVRLYWRGDTICLRPSSFCKVAPA